MFILGFGAVIGLFLAIIGLEIMCVVGYHPVTLVTLCDIKNPIHVINHLLSFIQALIVDTIL